MKNSYLFLLLLPSCTGSFDHGNWNGDICVTDTFNPDEQVLIYQAAQEWHNKSNDNVNLQLRFLHDNNTNNCDGIMSKKELPYDFGFTGRPNEDSAPVLITINTAVSIDKINQSSTFYQTVLHEFGHYLGANHSPSCNDTMYKNFHGVFHLTNDDVKQLWNPYPDHKYDHTPSCPDYSNLGTNL